MARWQTTRRATLFGGALLIAGALASAHAAELGGLSTRSLLASDQATTPTAPTILACDNFTGADTGSIAGRAGTTAATCATRTWAVHTTPVWGIQGNQARATGLLSLLLPAIATMDVGASDATVQATFTNLPALLGTQAGVVLGANAGASTYLSAALQETLVGGLLGDHVLLRCTCQAGTLASVDVTLNGTHTVQLTRVGTAVTVRLDGNVVLTHVLTGAQSSALGGTRAGIWTANNSVTADDFVVTTPQS